jgi:hypothetical protein
VKNSERTYSTRLARELTSTLSAGAATASIARASMAAGIWKRMLIDIVVVLKD